jgi:hypothetical protein
MKHRSQTIIGKLQKNAHKALGALRSGFATLLVLSLLVSNVGEAHALVFNFQDDAFHNIASEGLIINYDETGDEDATLQFGNDGTDGALVWDDGLSFFTTSDLFRFSDAEDMELIRLDDTTNVDSTGIYTGSGSPDGALSAEAGSIFLDQAGNLFVNNSVGSGTLWNQLAGVGDIHLDDAYNNFGPSASTLTIDAAEGQTGGLTFLGSLAGDETVSITNSGNGGALFVENTGTGDSFRVDDVASDTTPFIIDDAGFVGIGTDTPATSLHVADDARFDAELLFSAFDSARSTTITDPGDSPLPDIDGYLIVDSSGNVEKLQSNEGVVKINGDVNGLPTFNTTAGVQYQVTYESPLTISTSTDWPETAPADEDSFYDFATDKFLENPVNFQPHLFRVIINYSGFTTGGTDKIYLRLTNPLSGFVVEDSIDVPKGFTFGTGTFNLWTIADSASIGNGYRLFISTTDDANVAVESVTRFSIHKD